MAMMRQVLAIYSLVLSLQWSHMSATFASSMAIPPMSTIGSDGIKYSKGGGITCIVTGATGKVGSRLARQLLDMNTSTSTSTPNKGKEGNEYASNNIKVIALVRDAEKLRSMLGVESKNRAALTILQADYSDPAQLSVAFDSISKGNECKDKPDNGEPYRLFLACGNVPNQAQLEINILNAAKEATKADFCAKLSTATPIMEAKDSEGVSGYAKEHRSVEDYLEECEDMPHCILRPNMFMQVLTAGSFLGINVSNKGGGDADAPIVAEHPMAESACLSMIDCEDVAAAAAAILTCVEPQKQHDGQVYELTGPEAIRITDQVARAVSNELGRPVQINEVALEDCLEKNGIPAAAAAALGPFLSMLGQYDTVTSDFETLVGRPARTIRDFVHDSRETLEGTMM